jgi:hypothetical protein
VVETIVTYVIGPVLVAAVAGFFGKKATSVARDARNAAETAVTQTADVVPTTAQVLAILNRLEGRVEGIHDHVQRISDWRAIHDAQHALAGSSGLRLRGD